LRQVRWNARRRSQAVFFSPYAAKRMSLKTPIPQIDILPLFGEPSAARDEVDAQVLSAAVGSGFLTVSGAPSASSALSMHACESLLRVFRIPVDAQRRLWKQNFEPSNANLYRGWFPLESGVARSREGFEIGPDLVRSLPPDDDDLLYQPSVWPPEELLPGWRSDAAAFYLAMEDLGGRLVASLARGLGIPEEIFRDAFRDGISTLRLLHYPGRSPSFEVPRELKNYFKTIDGKRSEIVTGAHLDSGLVTILAQCGVGGLQAQAPDGKWIDVPCVPDCFAVNFGGLLELWTGGRVVATRHRVLSTGAERFSIPFFLEPRPDTLISPLPLPGDETKAQHFEPFLFGDHLWATTTKFPENEGLGYLRPARAPYRDPFSEG
jgi:isopenicillin N synthase-like dioxygenase